jgi:hypothetical protein
MDGLALGIATLVLSVPAMLALWHQGIIRKMIAAHEFRPGRPLHRVGTPAFPDDSRAVNDGGRIDRRGAAERLFWSGRVDAAGALARDLRG